MTGQDGPAVSIRGIFGDNIVLRNLEPKNQAIPGLGALRDSLSIPQGVIPRKNEVWYSAVVEAFIQRLCGPSAKTIFYIGDSFHNDGQAIRNLSERTAYKVLGYLCNDTGKNVQQDLCLGELIFSSNWANLWKLYKEGKDRGLALGTSLVALFDLDQTVYAAKGRHDGPLRAARLAAVHKILSNVIPPHRYDLERIEAIYRELDKDRYHPLTLDNQDYVVFLTLILGLGIYDMETAQRWLQSSTPIRAIIGSALEKVMSFAQYEQLGPVLDSVREVFFNDSVGDQTPFKTFREAEYFATREWMLHRASDSRISMTREVVELILFLRSQGSPVLALSDRPLESTEPDPQIFPGCESLLDIPLTLQGNSIRQRLDEII